MKTESVRGYRRRLATLSLAMLLPSLGISIANVALPTLSRSFAASFQEVQWVVIAYVLAVTTLVVAAGRLGDLLGRRRLLLAGVGLFAAASASCVIAPDIWVLVAARAVQGSGAAIIMALTVASVGDVVPEDRTGSAMGLLGTVSAVGTALGPSLGGALISWLGWSAVFAFMAGTGAAAFAAGWRYFPADASAPRQAFTVDLKGILLLALSLGAYAMLTTRDGATSGTISVTLAGIAVAALAAFIAVELRTASPLIQLGLLRDAELSGGLLSTGLVSAIVMATLVVGPFYLSGVVGLSPAAVGLLMSVGPSVAAATGLPAGRLVDRLGSSAIAIAGLCGVVLGSLLMTFLPAALGAGGYVGSLALITAAYALFQAANNTAVMARAPADRRGVTSALLALTRNLGLLTGATAMGAVFATGSQGIAAIGLRPGGDAGIKLTFAVAAALAVIALAAVWRGTRRRTGGVKPT